MKFRVIDRPNYATVRQQRLDRRSLPVCATVESEWVYKPCVECDEPVRVQSYELSPECDYCHWEREQKSSGAWYEDEPF